MSLLNLGYAVVGGLVADKAYEAVSNYISKSTSSSPAAPAIPTSKRVAKVSPKVAQKASLRDFAIGMGTAAHTVSTQISNSVSTAKEEATSLSDLNKAKTSELLTPSASSPLLTNQVFIKGSIDGLIDAINANTLVTASVFGTLDANLSAIGSSLTAISGTLIEVADNYKSDLLNTGDIPYIDQETYYKMLADSGLGFFEINDLINQENMLYNSLVAQGYDYDDIKSQIQNWRKYTVPITNQLGVEKEIAGISRAPRVNSDGSVSSVGSSVDLSKLNDFAISQKEVNDYLKSKTDIKDLDGNLIASVSPLEAQSVKNITEARYRTDLNNFEMSDIDYDDMFDGDFPDISAMFSFDKKSDRLTVLRGSL